MLARVSLTCAVLLLAAGPGFAQVQIDDLAAPSSPAFVLLDVAPASVERPDTPKQLTLNLLNSIASASGFPDNYALEVAPYWLASHPTLTFDAYQNPGVWQSMAQTFAVSIATSPIPGAPSGAEPLGTNLGLGLRVSVYNGRASPAVERLVRELEGVNFEILDEEARARQGGTPADTKALLAEASALALRIQAADAERVGFFLTLAGGQVWAYPDDNVRNFDVGRRGFWVTLDRTGTGHALGRRRAVHLEGHETASRLGRGVTALRHVERRRRRHRQQPLRGVLEYRIREDLILFGSFGQDFEELIGRKPLVSLLGLNLGFGKKSRSPGSNERLAREIDPQQPGRFRTDLAVGHEPARDLERIDRRDGLRTIKSVDLSRVDARHFQGPLHFTDDRAAHQRVAQSQDEQGCADDHGIGRMRVLDAGHENPCIPSSIRELPLDDARRSRMCFERAASAVGEDDVADGVRLGVANDRSARCLSSDGNADRPANRRRITLPVTGVGVGTGGVHMVVGASVQPPGDLKDAPRQELGTVPRPLPCAVVLRGDDAERVLLAEVRQAFPQKISA
jgi:hypothetical protein